MGPGQIGLSNGHDEERPRSARRQHTVPPASDGSSKTPGTEGSDTLQDLGSHKSGNVFSLSRQLWLAIIFIEGLALRNSSRRAQKSFGRVKRATSSS